MFSFKRYLLVIVILVVVPIFVISRYRILHFKMYYQIPEIKIGFNSHDNLKNFLIVMPYSELMMEDHKMLSSLLFQSHPKYAIAMYGEVPQSKQTELHGKVQDLYTKAGVDYVPKKVFFCPSLDTLLHKADPDQVVILMDKKSWLLNDQVLEEFNKIYSNQNVWLTFSDYVSYPSYRVKKMTDQYLDFSEAYKHRRKWKMCPIRTFYAGIYQQTIRNHIVSTRSNDQKELDIKRIGIVARHSKGKIRHINEAMCISYQ